MALTACAIRLESRGPVLFWQERIGREGETFQMAKFRSMYPGNPGEEGTRRKLEHDLYYVKHHADSGRHCSSPT